MADLILLGMDESSLAQIRDEMFCHSSQKILFSSVLLEGVVTLTSTAIYPKHPNKLILVLKNTMPKFIRPLLMFFGILFCVRLSYWTLPIEGLVLWNETLVSRDNPCAKSVAFICVSFKASLHRLALRHLPGFPLCLLLSVVCLFLCSSCPHTLSSYLLWQFLVMQSQVWIHANTVLCFLYNSVNSVGPDQKSHGYSVLVPLRLYFVPVCSLAIILRACFNYT